MERHNTLLQEVIALSIVEYLTCLSTKCHVSFPCVVASVYVVVFTRLISVIVVISSSAQIHSVDTIAIVIVLITVEIPNTTGVCCAN